MTPELLAAIREIVRKAKVIRVDGFGWPDQSMLGLAHDKDFREAVEILRVEAAKYE